MSLVMSKKWRLICSVRPTSLLVSGVPVMGISVITHVSFLGFAFATLAVFDTVHDSFAWSACKPKYTHTMYVLLLANCLYACCPNTQAVDTEEISLHVAYIHSLYVRMYNDIVSQQGCVITETHENSIIALCFTRFGFIHWRCKS